MPGSGLLQPRLAPHQYRGWADPPVLLADQCLGAVTGQVRTKDEKHPDKVLHDQAASHSWLEAELCQLAAGVPLITVSAHLGHEDAATTARIYGHLDRSAGRAVADAIATLLR